MLHCKNLRRFYGKMPGIWLPVLLPLLLRASTCINGWMTCDFTSFSILFQDDRRLIMKGCVQWSLVYGGEDFATSGDQTRSARSVGQHLTH